MPANRGRRHPANGTAPKDAGGSASRTTRVVGGAGSFKSAAAAIALPRGATCGTGDVGVALVALVGEVSTARSTVAYHCIDDRLCAELGEVKP